MQTILTFWPDNSQHQLCWGIKYSSYARDLNGKPHLINMLVFVLHWHCTATHRQICELWALSVLAGEIWKYLSTPRLTRLTLDMCPLLSTTVQSPCGYYRRSVSPIRANTDHWRCLLIEFHIFKNNLRCFVLKSDMLSESIILDYIFGG